MTTVRKIYDFINSIAPFDIQETWDNSGMLVGSFEKEVKTVAVCLDVSKITVKKAIDANADLIVSHHPVIFHPLKNVLCDNLIYDLIRNNIDVIGAHTNWDAAQGGVNDVLAQLFELKNVKPLQDSECTVPILRSGELKVEMSPDAFAEFVSEKLDAPLRFVKGNKNIKTVAVAGGGGGSLTSEIAAMGVDAYVTGDVKHNELLDAQNMGLTLIAAGHYETENPAMPALAKKIKDNFPDLDIVTFDSNPVNFIHK